MDASRPDIIAIGLDCDSSFSRLKRHVGLTFVDRWLDLSLLTISPVRVWTMPEPVLTMARSAASSEAACLHLAMVVGVTLL
jgi:hypothetical protein